MNDLLSDFIVETRETLAAIAGEIAAWEADPADRARLDAIFRFVHTIKGSCGFLDLPRLERLSHAAEDVLAAVRSGARTPDRALVDAVLAIVDRIRTLIDMIEDGAPLPDGEDGLLIAALAPGAAPAPAMLSAPAPRTVRSIRVSVDLLDRMIAGCADLACARDEVARHVRDARIGGTAEDAVERLSLAVEGVCDTIMRTRLARADQLFAPLPRMARELARRLGRDVALVLEGGDVALDREMIEAIRDPLMHIVRNAIDHGIEPPAERNAAGKPPRGRLAISARRAGERILIEISDDGRGIDADALIARAVAAGILTPDRAAALTPAARLELIFVPGLSTARAVTNISGRGVGMDVVRDGVERIGGHIEIDSRLGQGLRLRLRLRRASRSVRIVAARGDRAMPEPSGRAAAASPAQDERTLATDAPAAGEHLQPG